MNNKIGIMGGTFNPIHNGHLTMARNALIQYELDEVIFLPAGLQWMKKDSPDWIDAQSRYEMTALAVADQPHFRSSRMEIDRPGNTYTFETLEILRKNEPSVEYYYIIGTDTLANMPNWKHPELVFSQCVVLCALRDRADAESYTQLCTSIKEQFPDSDIRTLVMEKIDISSSSIRQAIADGKEMTADILPDAVIRYIRSHGLYRSPGKSAASETMRTACQMSHGSSYPDGNSHDTISEMIAAFDMSTAENRHEERMAFYKSVKDKLRDSLDEKRFLHTVSVAQTAAALAMRYGEDPYQAYTAGLLHDCAKGLKNRKKLKLAEEYGLEINDAERDNPDLLHAKLGVIIAKKEYGVTDEKILSAIRYHTTGKPNMTTLEKIVYIADFIEIYRKPLAIMETARNEAFRDLDAGMRIILEGILHYLEKKGALIDPITQKTYEYYHNNILS